MTIYTFYLCREDGVATTFDVFDLASDAEVPARALFVMSQHETGSYVNVWCGERHVMKHQRAETPVVRARNDWLHE